MDIPKQVDILPLLIIHYDLVTQIGEGSFSKVWEIKDKDGKSYACKIPEDKEHSIPLVNEAQIMSHISKYPNTGPFLTFYGLYSYGNKPVMVSELFHGEQLQLLIIAVAGNRIILTEDQILYITKLIFEQISYLHNKGFAHGDLHGGNILYNKDRLVLIDVGGQGLLEQFDNESNAEIVNTTVEIWNKAIKSGISPNILVQKGDIFDAGILIYRLVMKFNTPHLEAFIANNDKYKLVSKYPKIDVIVNSCMNIDITQRPSADDILTYINTYNNTANGI